jgi:hypothetical protein
MDMKRIRRTDRFYDPQVNKLDLPMLAGSVKMTLKNVHNGKTEVIEKHNAPTNALAHIFAGNYGGLMNYHNFEDLYRTWLGGVLVFGNPLDTSAVNDYGIPAYTSNPVRAHAGQTTISDQADDLTRGNPDSSRTVTTAGSTKLVFEWGTSAGNGVISSLGLTHSDVGSYGAGVVSTAQRSLNPFADVGAISRSYSYGDNADSVLAINGNTAYNFYFVDNTTVHIYKTPINNTKFKLQGGSLTPLTAYTQMITATLPNSYAMSSKGSCYYWFDFANNKLVLFGVETVGGETLYRDDVDLTDGTVTHQTLTITGARLWKFTVKGGLGQDYRYMAVPTRAMVYDNYIYLYGYTSDSRIANKMFKVNLTNQADITEIDTDAFNLFTYIDGQYGVSKIGDRFTKLGGIIVHGNYLINGDKTFRISDESTTFENNKNYANAEGISSPVFGLNTSMNMISVCKMYLATKFNLDTPVTKTSAQSMTVEYTLTEV